MLKLFIAERKTTRAFWKAQRLAVKAEKAQEAYGVALDRLTTLELTEASLIK
jgi:hypothetical protein